MKTWIASAALVMAMPVAAAAQPAANVGAERFRLRWAADAACALEHEVGTRALQLLGASAIDATKPPLEVNAQVSRAAGGFLLSLTLGEGARARTRFMTAPTCEELAHAAALVIALAIKPSLDVAAQETAAPRAPVVASPQVAPCPAAPPADPHPESTPSAAPPAPIAPCPRCTACPPLGTSVPKQGHRVGPVLGVGFALGALPQALPRPSLGLAYTTGSHWLEAGLSGAFAALGPRADQSGATFQLWLLNPRYCLRTAAWPGRVGACASVEGGVSRATGIGLPTTHTQWSAWAVPALGVHLGVPFGSRSELTLNADLGFAVSPTSFRLNAVEVFRPWPVLPTFRVAALL